MLKNSYIYLESISKTDVTKKYLELKFELHLLKTKSNTEKNIVITALMIKEKIKDMKDTYALASASTRLK